LGSCHIVGEIRRSQIGVFFGDNTTCLVGHGGADTFSDVDIFLHKLDANNLVGLLPGVAV